MKSIKTVAIELDRTRHLCYDVNALIDLSDALHVNLLSPEGWEELAGKNVPTGVDGETKFVAAAPTFERVRAIVWAGLRKEDESLTLRQVGAMLDPLNMGDAIKAYTEAWDIEEPAADTESPNEGSQVAGKASLGDQTAAGKSAAQA
jgi:hypothetical protein